MIERAARPNLPAYLASAQPRLVAKLTLGPIPAAEGLRGPCLDWKASVNGSGYPQLYVTGGTALAHRVAYLIYVGPIADGMNVHHRCERITCVNPHHLELIPESKHIAGHNRSRRKPKVLHQRMERQADGRKYKVTFLAPGPRPRIPAGRPTRRGEM
jgi:HNH endonuclease